MRPLIGYNYGAGEYRRVRKIYELTLALCAGIMAIGTILFFGFSEQLVGMFSTNPETIRIGQSALRIISLGFIVSAISVATSGALEGLGKGIQSLVISLCRYIVVIIPLAWGLCKVFGADGVWHAFWITEVISAVIALLVYRRSVKLS